MAEMKDSGIEWIGKIPKEWSNIKLKSFYDFEKGKNAQLYTAEYIGKHEGQYPVFSGQTENNGVMGFIDTYDYELNECLFTTTVGAKVMTPKLLKGKFSLSQNCLIMKPKKECNNHFFFYCLISLFDYEKGAIPSYMQPSLRIDDLKKYGFYIPDLENQNRIADFLDKKCAEIDILHSDIEKQIHILEEYKKSIITEAVTRGLDPDVEMKDSGSVYWKDIPANWKLSDIKYLFEIVKRIAGKEGYDILSVTQKGLKIKDISRNEGQIAESYANYQFVYPTDYVMNHMDLLTGWVDCSKYFGVTSPDYRVFRLKDKKNNLNYYKYIMQCCYMDRIFYSLGQGVSNLGRWRLQTESFNNFQIPVPPAKEQEQIAKYLDEKCIEIENIILDKQQQLETLEQYKKSLIYEYVTGKKEVK